MYSEINPVLELLDKRMKHIETNVDTGGGGVGVGITDLAAFEENWEGQLNEFAARIDGMAVFAVEKWFRSRMECVYFSEKHTLVGQFQWFIDIVSYLKLVTGEITSTAESQRY